MLCLLHRCLLFRFNMAASGARIPRIFSHKRMLTSYLMGVSSILIKELFDIIDCLELFLVACNKFFFHIIPEKRGRLIRRSWIFSSYWGKKLGGRLIRAVDLYASIYGNRWCQEPISSMRLFHWHEAHLVQVRGCTYQQVGVDRFDNCVISAPLFMLTGLDWRALLG